MVCPNCGRQIMQGGQCECAHEGMYSSNPAIDAIKRIGASVPFLIFTLLQTVALVLSLIPRSISVIDVLYDMEYAFYDAFGYYPDFTSNIYDYGFYDVGYVDRIFSAIPAIITVIALWLLFAACRNRNVGGMSTAGLTILKVMQIITLVFICIAILAVVIACIAVMTESAGVGIAIFISCALILTPVFLYVIKCIQTINSAKRVVATGMPNDKASMYVIVILYIGAGFMAISAVLSLVSLMNYGSAISVVTSAVSAAQLFFAAYLLGIYRKSMRSLIYNPPAVYQHTPYGQQNVVGYAPPVQQNVVYPNSNPNMPYGNPGTYTPPTMYNQVPSQGQPPQSPGYSTVQPPSGAQPPIQNAYGQPPQQTVTQPAQTAATPVPPVPEAINPEEKTENPVETASQHLEEAKAVFASEDISSSSVNEEVESVSEVHTEIDDKVEEIKDNLDDKLADTAKTADEIKDAVDKTIEEE